MSASDEYQRIRYQILQVMNDAGLQVDHTLRELQAHADPDAWARIESYVKACPITGSQRIHDLLTAIQPGAIDLRRHTPAWRRMPGKALNMGIGADGSVWHVGTALTGNGLGIYRWKGGEWEQVEGAGVGIAIGPTGEPWIWNLFGEMYRREGETWHQMPGIARYIAIGANGSAWHVGTVETFYTGYGLYRWGVDNWEQVAGAAVGIAVAPDGTPWHWNSIGEIYKGEGDTWRQMPGLATHLAIGAEGSMWHIRTDQRGDTGYGIYRWDEGAWEQKEGAGIGIAVGPDGVPWCWTAHGDIYKAV